MEIRKINEELTKVLNETFYSNLKTIVWEINKILVNGARAVLKKRIPKDLKEDGVEVMIEIKNPNKKALELWGIYPDMTFLCCEWTGSIDTVQTLDYENNTEGYSSHKFIGDIFQKYGYKWAK